MVGSALLTPKNFRNLCRAYLNQGKDSLEWSLLSRMPLGGRRFAPTVYFKKKTKEVQKLLPNHSKTHTRGLPDSTQLLQKQDKGFSRLFQTTSKAQQ